MRLPERFVSAMRELLGGEAEAFLASYEVPRTSGLRLNGRKTDPEAYARRFGEPGTGKPIPWAEGGFYTEEEDRPGKHLHYYLGLYYIQEPSAMLPAELLGVRPGHRVLDLCAAPGGKSTQLAGKLAGRGLLVTNDNAAERTKALAKNVERAGAVGVVVTNEEPARLAETFGAFFDRVLVDAPCSGEGMFRKDEEMVREWDRHADPVGRYAAMQRDILREAARMVAPGGKLLYSTCTFAPEENEGSVARLLAERPDFAVEPVEAPEAWGFGPGRPDWLSAEAAAGLPAERLASLAGTVRVWPHRSRGEGHYAALLVRRGEEAGAAAQRAEEGAGWRFPPLEAGERYAAAARPQAPGKPAKGGRGAALPQAKGKPAAAAGSAQEMYAMLQDFAREMLPSWRPSGRVAVRGEKLYLLPEGLPPLGRLNAVRPGLLLGAATKHRFEPSQALAMGLRMIDASRSLRLTSDEDEALKYMKGETLHPDPARVVGADGSPAAGRGWALVCVDGYPAGWGRWDGAQLKNELLPGWRWV